MLSSSDNSERISRKRSAPKKVSKLKLLTLAIIAVFVIYLTAAVTVSIRSNLSTTVALNGTVTESIKASGYVFRNQSVIKAPGGGHFECVVTEGERVREGQTIGYVCEKQPNPDVSDKLHEIHKLIKRNGLDEDSKYYSSDAGSSEKKISELIRSLSDLRQNYNLSDAEEKKDEINLVIRRKNAESAETTSNADLAPQHTENAEDSGQLRLKDELSATLAKLGPHMELKAPNGGVFSARIDGLEEQLAYDNASAVTPSVLRDLDKTELSISQAVETGAPLCKIINNYVWRFATEMSEKDLKNIKEGQSIRLEFFDLSNNTISGTVSKISAPENGKCAVVISTNKHVSGIYSSSRINARLVTVNAEGIKIPVECLHVKDESVGVYVVRLDRAVFVPVNVRYKNETWAVVNAAEPEPGGARLKIHDEVIVSCKRLEDGKVVR